MFLTENKYLCLLATIILAYTNLQHEREFAHPKVEVKPVPYDVLGLVVKLALCGWRSAETTDGVLVGVLQL